MQFFRNPEIKTFVWQYACLSFLFCILAAVFTGSFFCTAFTLAVCLLSAAFFLSVTAKRYRTISDLTFRLDQVLHDSSSVSFSPDTEGELALLSCEIGKLILRLREQAELLHKDKVYLKDFLADTAHQLKTPMTALELLIPRFRQDALGEDERLAYVRQSLAHLSHMDWLLSTLLKTARLESGAVTLDQESILIQSLIDASMKPLEIMLEVKSIQVSAAIQPDACFTGDFLWTCEALENILKNCGEHTPEHGTLTISAVQNPIYTEISIEDSGSGIKEEDLPHLFERFYQGSQNSSAPEQKSGNFSRTGIGLSLSHMIISRQNGTLTAKNLDSGGSGFYIRFYHAPSAS